FLLSNPEPSHDEPIPRSPEAGLSPVPLSSNQARLWVFDELVPNSPLYNVSFALRLKGALSQDALLASLTALVNRHPLLRATFPEREERPQVVILPEGGWSPSVVDLRDLGSEEREARLHHLAAEHAAIPFDLAGGPLMRAVLVMLEDADHALLITQHHII